MAHSQSGGHRNKADRREDIEQNLAYELSRFSQKSGKHISFNKEARERFLTFALDPDNRWLGNFRDLNAMVVRMATLSDGGRITSTSLPSLGSPPIRCFILPRRRGWARRAG